MDWIVKLADWEIKTPSLNQRRQEQYWTAVELPLDTEFFFIVNTREVRSTRTPARSTAVTTTAKLLDFLGRIDPALVNSAYILLRGHSDQRSELEMHRIRSIRAGDVEQLGWTRMVVIDAEDGVTFTDPNTDEQACRWANEIEVFNFAPEDGT